MIVAVEADVDVVELVAGLSRVDAIHADLSAIQVSVFVQGSGLISGGKFGVLASVEEERILSFVLSSGLGLYAGSGFFDRRIAVGTVEVISRGSNFIEPIFSN